MSEQQAQPTAAPAADQPAASQPAQNQQVILRGDRFTKNIYCDGICQVNLVNGTVKLDLLEMNPTGVENQTEALITNRVVMSLQQFINSVDVMNTMMDRMVQQGIISKED